MRKIKVLHIHTLPIVSGSGLNTFLSMQGLDKEKYEVELACAPGGELIKLVEDNGMKVVKMPRFRRQVDIISDTLSVIDLMRLFRRAKYDIIHTHNSKAGVIGRIAARICGVPIIVHTVHSCVFKYANLNPLERRLYFFIEKFCASFTDKLITISEPLKNDFISARVGRPSQYVTVYSGIQIERFCVQCDVLKKKEELGIEEGLLVVGMVSRVAEGKGHKELLQAAKKILARLKKVIFLIVGDGPLSKEIKDLALRLGIERNIIFTGARYDIEEVTQVFDVAVLPSYYEGMGRVLLEAQAAGKPVVATRSGGMLEIVKDNQTGFLVRVGDAEGLSEALYELLNSDDLRRRMGQEAAKWVGEKFSSRTMVSAINSVYQELIEKKLKT